MEEGTIDDPVWMAGLLMVAVVEGFAGAGAGVARSVAGVPKATFFDLPESCV